MRDECNAVVVIKDRLVISCKSRGIVITNMDGETIKTLNTEVGELRMYKVNKDSVAICKVGSNSIRILNVQNYQINCISVLLSINWMCCDQRSNIYFTALGESRIYKLIIESKRCISLSEIHEEIQEVQDSSGIDYNFLTHSILVVGRNGQTLHIFQLVEPKL